MAEPISPIHRNNGSNLVKLRALLLDMHSALLEDRPMQISVSNRAHKSPARHIKFPGQTRPETRQFAQLVVLVDIIHDCLLHSRVCTKRDIFYRNPGLFQSQKIVDKLVDDLAATLNVNRETLNVAAAAKGLVYGDLRIYLQDGCVVDCNANSAGTLIPFQMHIAEFELLGDIDHVLVVEKETIFRALLDSQPTAALRGTILVTGKGYPDLASREIVTCLSQRLSCSFSALVDWDPDGLQIMATYKIGSAAMKHEQLRLITDKLEWLGLKCEDLQEIIESRRVTHWSGRNIGQVELLRLTTRDRKKAIRMLKKNCASRIRDWKSQLQKMLFIGVKAEVDMLDLHDKTLARWILKRWKTPNSP